MNCATPFRWDGIDRRGGGHVGRSSSDVTAFVQAKYRAGWRRLNVLSDTVPAVVLGRIENHRDTGRRVWWTEHSDVLVTE